MDASGMREILAAIAETDLARRLLLGLAAGLLLGFIHFGSLWWNAQVYAGGGWAQALGLQLLRFCLLLAVLGALAWLGATFLLAGALGLLLARGLMLRFLGRQA
jgi:F1F0 ATPase subunit 2